MVCHHLCVSNTVLWGTVPVISQRKWQLLKACQQMVSTLWNYFTCNEQTTGKVYLPLLRCYFPLSLWMKEKKSSRFTEKEGGQDQKIQHCSVLCTHSLPLFLFLSGQRQMGRNFSFHIWQLLKFLSCVFNKQIYSQIRLFFFFFETSVLTH